MANATSGTMSGKTVVVTGATAGIGLQTAYELAKQGARVVIVGRDPGRGEAAVADVKRRSGSDQVELLLADFASFQSIRDAAAEYRRRHKRLDVLVNNVGKLNQFRTVTTDGLETTFAVNHLGYFLFTHLLLDVLQASAPARIVNVSSAAHLVGKLDFEDLQTEKKPYKSMTVYGTSKLANLHFTYELAERLKGTGVTVNALHPGTVNSNFGGDLTGVFGVLMRASKKLPFMITVEKGAATSVYLASSPEVEGVSGKYFEKKKAVSSNRASHDAIARRRLWEESERLTGIASSAPRAAAG